MGNATYWLKGRGTDPLIVEIHGGPQAAFGVGLDVLHQFLVAQGFAILYCNPHGSTGHGQDFMREVEGDWGGWDYEDIMRGVDACITRGIADPERLMVTEIGRENPRISAFCRFKRNSSIVHLTTE